MFFKKREYGSTKNLDMEQLRVLFQDKRLSYIKLALLFGSRANAQQSAQSDYDIAILADNSREYEWGVLSKAYNDIGDVLNLPEYDYDIVDLQKTNSLLKENIQKNHKILKGDNDELQQVFTSNSNSCK